MHPCCDACGRVGQPMLRCTRCQSAYYHDDSCQRQHWPIHRKTCRETKASGRTTARGSDSSSSSSSLPYRIATRSGRGNSLVTSRRIRKDETFGCFKPLVPPVLHAKYRGSHCAWCLVKVDDETTDHANTRPLLDLDHKHHPVLACSVACQKALTAPTSLFRCEAEAIRKLKRNNCGPPVYLPTALLVYRLAASVALRQVSVNDLLLLSIGGGGNPDSSSQSNHHHPNDDAALAHELAVLQTAQVMLDASSSSFPWPPPTAPVFVDLKQLLNRIKINSVSIRDVGFGIFRLAHLANHSCQPTADQVFIERRGMTPRLHLTSRTAMEANDEITVSYIDETQPKEIRQTALASQYGFHCTCNKCTGPSA